VGSRYCLKRACQPDRRDGPVSSYVTQLVTYISSAASCKHVVQQVHQVCSMPTAAPGNATATYRAALTSSNRLSGTQPLPAPQKSCRNCRQIVLKVYQVS
jgi:hypothetical protein